MREVYHISFPETTGSRPELSIEVILSITFFDKFPFFLHLPQFFQLRVQPGKIFFQLRRVRFGPVVPVIEGLPELFPASAG